MTKKSSSRPVSRPPAFVHKPAIPLLLPPEAVGSLIAVLAGRGFTVLGPVLRDGAIVFDEVQSLADLPAGWTAEEQPARYRLAKRGDQALFGYPVGIHSLKRYFHPPDITLFRAEREDESFRIRSERPPAPRYAVLGVRPCDLAALALQDRVLLGDRYVDDVYKERRDGAFLVAVNCTEPGGTCFCASLGTGPRATAGYDILLTELVAPDRHVLVAEAGSARGQEALAELGVSEAPAEVCQAAEEVLESAAGRMGRSVNTQGLKETLYEAFEHPRWDHVAARCMSCGNCTQVCPTCFCVTVEDSSDVEQRQAERRRRWDSCFTQSFSYIHGGSVRLSPRSRYRHWLTHKFAAWQDQFGSSGCVGCGRCITWCPAGIDVTEELAALRPAASAAGV